MNITPAIVSSAARPAPAFGAIAPTPAPSAPPEVAQSSDQFTPQTDHPKDYSGLKTAAWVIGTATVGCVLGSQASALSGIGSHIAGVAVGAAGGVVPGVIAGAMLGSVNDTSGWGGLSGGIIGGAAGGVIGGIAGGVLGSSAFGATLGGVAGALGGIAGGFVLNLRTSI